MNRKTLHFCSFILIAFWSTSLISTAGQVQAVSSHEPVSAMGELTDSAASKASGAQGNRKRVDSDDDRLAKDVEQAAIEFAQQHQPAMASLVKRLQNRDSEAYGKAIRELSADTVRLSRLKERQPQRFENELALWKVDSEIRLQLARFAVNGSERVESSLRRLLAKRQGLRRQRLVAERKRLQTRMKTIDEQLSLRGPQLKEDVEREWLKLTRKVRSPGDKSAVRKKPTKDDLKPGMEKPKTDRPNTNKKGLAKPKSADSGNAKGESSTSEKPRDADQTPTTHRQ